MLAVVLMIIIAIAFLRPIPGFLNSDEFSEGCIKSDQIKILNSINELIEEKKTNKLGINEIFWGATNMVIIDEVSNSIRYSYPKAEWIIPYLSHKYVQRTIHIKYFISRDGMIIVYSYYFPKVGEKNVLVTICNRKEDKKYEQKYVTENEMLSILKKNGLTLKQLSVAAPSWEDDAQAATE